MKQKAKYMRWIFVVLSLCYTVYADMHVRLNNGQTLTLPIEAKDIASIDFKKKQALRGKNKSSNQTPNTPRKMIYQVGPSFLYSTPSDIARVVRDDSVVEIEAGVY